MNKSNSETLNTINTNHHKIIISNQNEQIIKLVNLINEYDKTVKLQNKFIEENNNTIQLAKSYFHLQTLLFILFVVLLYYLFNC